MERLIAAAIILIIIMLAFVFILFKNIIKRIDENAKKYFVNKMQSYDYILEEKQTKLEEIKNEIEIIKSENKNILKESQESDYIFRSDENKEETKNQQNEEFEDLKEKKRTIKYNLNEPEYRDTSFFSNYKELKKIFTINNEKIIRDFIKNNKNQQEEKEYKSLKKIREEFNDDAIYGLITLSTDNQKKLLREILKPQEKKILSLESLMERENFNIKDLIRYIDNRMEEIEPTIYIYVNGVANNYDFINKNIVTKQYTNMSEGIIIKYRNKIYDYSI